LTFFFNVNFFPNVPITEIDIHLASPHEKRKALHKAVMQSCARIVEVLLNHGARDDKSDHTGHFAYEYITSYNIKNRFFLHYKMRISTEDSSVRKQKTTFEASIPAFQQKRVQLVKDNSPLLTEMLRVERTQTALQPMCQEIEIVALYDPADRTANSFI
jgi:hypothetical protein